MSNNTPTQIKLAQITQQLKRKVLVEWLMLTSAVWVVICYTTLYLCDYSGESISGLLSAYVIFILLLTKTQRYRQISQQNVLEHLNRQFPQFEESAQLLVANSGQRPLLSRIQQQKVTKQFLQLTTNKAYKQKLLGNYRYKTPLFCALIIIALSVFFQPFPLLEHYLSQAGTDNAPSTINEVSTPNTLLFQKIIVEPPSYTGLSSSQSDNMNIKAIVGSKVIWQLSFTQTNPRYSLVFSNGQQLDLMPKQDYFTAELKVSQTGLYQIKVGSDLLPQIYTLEVINDQRPSVRILTPKLTITEILTDAQPNIETRVQVSDDFGLSKVDILASIAKGSGEAVKFRDQVFEFDHVKTQMITQSNTDNSKVNEYQKNWNLTELNMAPGDELYFSVRAWDNKSPEPQLTQSITKIVRWLEDSEQAVMADGVLIDFMPEYFKSQRQIIIETEQLIADSSLFTPTEFSKTSLLLGIAQSDLKQKYGQYLGDEFEDVGSEQVATLTNEHVGADTDEEHQDEVAHDDEHQHDSGQQNTDSEGVQSAYETVLAKYAHTHEDSDVGLMGKQDPVALMKRSVANMWEAELYLMLSKPEQALPYERQALKFLKMAQKAERIYVKRLGFEPPPVNENRRYQGELDEINSLSQSQQINAPISEYQTLSDAFILLTQDKQPTEELTTSQRALLTQVKVLFIQQLSTRPALIEFVATLEKILLGNRIQVTDCQGCIVKLRNKIWQLMPIPNAVISSGGKKSNTIEALTSAYIDNLKQVSKQVTQSNTLQLDVTEGKP